MEVKTEETFKGWTPLMKAAEENRVEIARLLLEHNANINATNRKGRSVLSFAAAPSMNRNTACDTLRLLLDHGADVNLKDENGQTAKGHAKKEERDDALAIFREHGK